MSKNTLKMQTGTAQYEKNVLGLYHPLDGINNPKYNLLHFLTTNFLHREEGSSFSRDRCWYRALSLWLILFHWLQSIMSLQLVYTKNLYFNAQKCILGHHRKVKIIFKIFIMT
jgi:hypothetical protein